MRKLRLLTVRRIGSISNFPAFWLFFKVLCITYRKAQWYSTESENFIFLVARVSGSYAKVWFSDGAW
jgi:hypothetical protein